MSLEGQMGCLKMHNLQLGSVLAAGVVSNSELFTSYSA